MRFRPLLLVMLVALGCASQRSGRPATIAQPDMDARLAAPLFFGSSDQAPATIELVVLNRANKPIVVRRVEVDSPGMAEYTLLRNVRDFRETIAPGATQSFTIFATAVTTRRRPTEPLTIRAIVELEADGTRWREILIARE